MAGAASKDVLNMLHALLAQELIERVKERHVKTNKEGEPIKDKEGNFLTEKCPASVLAVAAKYLKDNDITAGFGNKDLSDLEKAMADLDNMPFDGEVPAEYRDKQH